MGIVLAELVAMVSHRQQRPHPVKHAKGFDEIIAGNLVGVESQKHQYVVIAKPQHVFGKIRRVNHLVKAIAQGLERGFVG